MIKGKKFILYIILSLLIAVLLMSCIQEPVPVTEEITPVPDVTQEPYVYNESEWLKNAEAILPDYIPAQDMMQSPEYGSPQISKDGSKIFYRHIDTANMSDYIEIMDRKTGRLSNVPWPAQAHGIPYFYATPDSNKVLLFIDDSGDENFGLYIADIKNQQAKEIIAAGENDCMFMGFDKSNADECFIGVFDWSASAFHVYRFNMKNETFKLIMSNPGNIDGWEFDSKGRLVMVITSHEDASYKVWLRNDLNSTTDQFRESEWSNIITWDYEDADSSGVISIDDASENIIMLDSTMGNLISVVNYNIASGEKTILSQDAQGTYDPAGVWTDAHTGKVTGVAYLRERFEWESLDDSFGQHLSVLRNISDGEMNIVDSSRYDEVWLISYSYDTKSEDYYVYDAVTKEATFLFSSNPALDKLEFAPMEPISYTSSDGLTIHGYATFPLNMERTHLPMVILVHGGPWSRDTWGFNQEVQFLANRGYMVLQVNFRGSTGYGKDFMLAGDMEWGRKMHQDILDALDWAVEMGWADADRVAIYGASYGGYEALVSAAFTPERFACAIDLFGPSSLLTLVNSQPPQWNSYAQNLYRSIGDPAKDAMLMMERSPYYKADQISIPLMVVQGGNDVRVTQQESEQLVNAMHEAGLDVDYILFPDAGHGFSSAAQRKTFYEAAEKFLAEHIGGRSRIED